MENYNYNDNTLIHTIGFDLYKLESILNNGILSQKEAKKKQISYSKNYYGYNFDEYISLVRYLYVNFEDSNSVFVKSMPKGISFLIENQPFIYDQKEQYFNHSDEVFVKDKVDRRNIKGLLIPNKYQDYLLKDLPILPLKSTSYVNLKHCCDNIIKYLESYSYQVDYKTYNAILSEMYLTLELMKKEEDSSLLEDYNEVKYTLDDFIAGEVQKCFNKLLTKQDVTLMDAINYINNKTLKLPLYFIGDRTRGER